MGAVFALLVAGALTVACAEGSPHTFDSLIEPFLSNYCLDCHDADEPKGDLALDGLTEVTPENAEVWKRVWEQVALKEMPPRKKKNQPVVMDRLHVTNWITSELEKEMAHVGGFHIHHHPKKANHIPHELLFGDLPEGLAPPSTAARIWRIHPQDHLVRLNALINIDQAYDPKRPGVRTMGDHIPWNQQGEIKVYYALDRIKAWVGGSAAYAAAITGFPPVLSTDRGSWATQLPDAVLGERIRGEADCEPCRGHPALHGVGADRRAVPVWGSEQASG